MHDRDDDDDDDDRLCVSSFSLKMSDEDFNLLLKCWAQWRIYFVAVRVQWTRNARRRKEIEDA